MAAEKRTENPVAQRVVALDIAPAGLSASLQLPWATICRKLKIDLIFSNSFHRFKISRHALVWRFYQVALLGYRLHNGQLPTHLAKSRFDLRKTSYSQRNPLAFDTPIAWTSAYQNSPIFYSSTLFSQHIRNCTEFDHFKTALFECTLTSACSSTVLSTPLSSWSINSWHAALNISRWSWMSYFSLTFSPPHLSLLTPPIDIELFYFFIYLFLFHLEPPLTGITISHNRGQ